MTRNNLNLANKKVIFLDWNKTLSYSLFWSNLSKKNHPNHNYHETIITWLFKNNNHIIDAWMRGFFTSEDICELIAMDHSLDKKIIFNSLIESCAKMEIASKDTIKLVRKIRKKGIKVIIATDNMDTFRRFTVPSLKLQKEFDCILSSSELKHLKFEVSNGKIPFFEDYLNSNKLKYNEVILLDDSIDKSGQFNSLGFQTILIDNQNTLIKALRMFAE